MSSKDIEATRKKAPKTQVPRDAIAGREWWQRLSRDEALVYRALYEAVSYGGFSLFGFGDAPEVCGTEHPLAFVREIIHTVDDDRQAATRLRAQIQAVEDIRAVVDQARERRARESDARRAARRRQR